MATVHLADDRSRGGVTVALNSTETLLLVTLWTESPSGISVQSVGVEMTRLEAARVIAALAEAMAGWP